MTFDAGAIEAKLTLDRAQFKAELAAARAEGDAFARRRFTAKLDVDATAAKASMASASAVYDTLRARLSQPIVVDVQTAGANAAILTTIGLLDKLHAKAGTIILPGGAGGGGRVGGGFFGLPRLFGGRVNLFGGILPGLLASIGTVHLLIDAFVELVAVILPATIAFGIFAAAAAPTVGDIATKMQQINTVVVATGKNIAPLTGAFTRMADAVRPSVYQLFGNALQIAGRNTGLFQQLAVGTGHVITDLAARFTLAATNGHGFNIFLANAVPDLAKLGDIVGNIGGTFANVFKQMPGYAQTLLSLADAGTKIIEWASSAAGVLIHLGLAFHGAFLYVGLLTTALAFLATRGLSLLATGLLGVGVRIERFGVLGARAATAMGNLAGSTEKAAGLPWGFIALAAVALGYLTYKLVTAKDATERWISSVQDLTNAQSASTGYGDLLLQQIELTNRLNIAQTHLTAVAKDYAKVAYRAGPPPGLAQAHIDVSALTQAEIDAINQTQRYTRRLNELGAAYGSNRNAIALLALAGIKVGDITNKNADEWAKVKLEVAAVALSYQSMGQRAGTLGSDLNALTFASADQLTKMTQLNQAWDTFIGTVQGGEIGFVTFEQLLEQVGTSAATAGASIRGLNTPSIALRSAWQQAFTQGSKLIDALRLQSSISPGGFPSVTRAVKDTIAQLIGVGKRSSITRQELVSLAQEIDPNVTSFKQLTAWLGNTTGAGKNLDKLVSQMGINIGTLTTDALKLSNTLRADVIAQFQSTLLHATGTSKAVQKLATDIANQGTTSAQYRTDRAHLIADLEKMGVSATDARSLIAAMVLETTKIPRTKTLRITVDAIGNWSVTAQAHARGQGPIGGPVAARGLFIDGGTSGVDDQLIRAQKGELVVPAGMVAAGLADHLRGLIPGFRVGGVVGGYRGGGPGVGRWEHVEYDKTTAAIEAATAAVTAAALRKQQQTTGWGTAGPGGGAPAANAALAQLMFGKFFGPGDWAAWNYVAMRESGWNQFATNPTSGAYGIPQALPPSKMPFAAQAAGGSNPAAQEGWMWGYMNAAYGGPRGAAAHEAAFNWYDFGGGLRPGMTLAMNTSGRTETVTPANTMEDMVDSIDDVSNLLEKMLNAIHALPGRTAGSLSGALNGIARTY